MDARSRIEWRFINAFRALAAFWVLAAHCQIWGGYPFLPIPAPKIAVDLFMLVSGFLMQANASTRNEPMSEPRNRVRFWTRRFFRIAPAYYLALTLIALGSGVFLPGKAYLQQIHPSALWVSAYDQSAIHITADNLAAHVTFLFGLLPQYASSTSLPDWSLGLEMQFYLAFPFLFLLRPRHLIAVTLAAFLLGGVFYGQFPDPSLLLFKLQYFAAGMLLYRALMATDARTVTLYLAAGLVLAGIEQGRQWQIAPTLLLAMFALGTLERHGQLPAFPRWVTYASDVSYSVYLFHGLLLGAFGATLAALGLKPSAPVTTLALFASVAVGTYLLAGVTYRWVELTGIRLGRRVLRGRRTGLVRVPDRQQGL